MVQLCSKALRPPHPAHRFPTGQFLTRSPGSGPSQQRTSRTSLRLFCAMISTIDLISWYLLIWLSSDALWWVENRTLSIAAHETSFVIENGVGHRAIFKAVWIVAWQVTSASARTGRAEVTWPGTGWEHRKGRGRVRSIGKDRVGQGSIGKDRTGSETKGCGLYLDTRNEKQGSSFLKFLKA